MARRFTVIALLMVLSQLTLGCCHKRGSCHQGFFAKHRGAHASQGDSCCCSSSPATIDPPVFSSPPVIVPEPIAPPKKIQSTSINQGEPIFTGVPR